MGVCRFGWTPPGTSLAVAGTGAVRRERKLGHRDVREAVGRIEGRVLIGAVAEGVLQVVIHAEAGADYGGVLVAKGLQARPSARLRQELRVVHGEGGVADGGLGGDDAVR